MNQISAKIYYLVATGEVLTITSECQGSVENTTKEQDMYIYTQLNNKNINDIDFIELEYGTIASTFNNSKSYKINLETKQLEIIYYTQEEIISMQQKNQEMKDLNSRTSDISAYLSSSDSSTIADIENSILEIEKNKILEGMM